MGNWTIVIEGTGIHHNNNNPNDADRLFQKIVTDLKEAGHTIQAASITCGSRQLYTTYIEPIRESEK